MPTRTRLALAATLAALALCAHVAPASAAPKLPPLADPPTGKHIPGKFVWFDLVTPDAAAARAFYANVFGWTFDDVPAGRATYAVARSGGLPIAGLYTPAATPAAGASSAAPSHRSFRRRRTTQTARPGRRHRARAGSGGL